MNRLEYWKQMISSAPLDYLANDLNPSWNPNTKKYGFHDDIPADILAILKTSNINTVLDFGTGLGRNLSYLRSLFPSVTGYDLDEMIIKHRALYPSETQVTSDWNLIKKQKFDLIYQCTVFQHLDIEVLDQTLIDIHPISRYLFMRTRVYNDVGRDFKYGTGGVNIYNHIKSKNLYVPISCTISYDAASTLNDETHYDILYKTI